MISRCRKERIAKNGEEGEGGGMRMKRLETQEE